MRKRRVRKASFVDGKFVDGSFVIRKSRIVLS
jgi:hypothetical protein